MARLPFKKRNSKKTATKRHTPAWLKKLGRIFRPLRFLLAPFRPFGRYVAGAWYELRQVKWPSNKTSIKLTGAVIAFTLAMTAFIVSLDYGFEQLVKRTLL